MRKVLSILVLMVAMLAGGAGIAQASELAPCEFEDSANCYWDASERGNGKGDSFVDVDGTAYYVGVHTECLTAPETCTIAEDGSMVGAQFYSDFPAPVEVAVPVAAEVVPVAPVAPVEFAPFPAVVYSMVTVDSAAAWALFDAVGAADLLPAEGAAVAYVGGWDGSALAGNELAVWDLNGNGYLFYIG